ncbi:MAG: hypothetical protein KF767_02410 [Bdellovibrionaceae bacterium]|nr:hypothetical protein [Pseudobdellovibrionaceae bacterium]
MQFDLSVAADGRALVDFPVFEYSRAGFDKVARELESKLGLAALAGGAAPAVAADEFALQYSGGFELRMGRASFALICPTPLRQYETAIRLKTEMRWKPECRVYAWAPVSDEVEELVVILYRTLALLLHQSPEYEVENPDVLSESVDHLKQVIAAIRNGDDWAVEDVHNIYFNVAGAKPDVVPAVWNEKFLKLAGDAGRALTAHNQSHNIQ